MASGSVLMPFSSAGVDGVPTPPALATEAAEKPRLSTAPGAVAGGHSRGGGIGGPTTAAGIGHTIHPKLSLSAKRSVGSVASTAGGAEMTVDGGQVGRGGTAMPGSGGAQQPNNGNHFKLNIRISEAENGTPIMFKQDGSRFSTSQRTLKLHSNCKYRIGVQCKPPQDFISLHIGGSDLELVSESAPCSSGEYTAMWNTTGIEPSRKGIRQDIIFVLSGPGKTLNRKLQTKFYARDDSHAGMGHRVEALCWTCELDPTGQVLVVDEKLL